MPINNDSITLWGILMPKMLKSTCSKLGCLSACKKSTLPLFYIMRYCKNSKLAILGIFGMLDHPYQKSLYQFL